METCLFCAFCAIIYDHSFTYQNISTDYITIFLCNSYVQHYYTNCIYHKLILSQTRMSIILTTNKWCLKFLNIKRIKMCICLVVKSLLIRVFYVFLIIIVINMKLISLGNDVQKIYRVSSQVWNLWKTFSFLIQKGVISDNILCIPEIWNISDIY